MVEVGRVVLEGAVDGVKARVLVRACLNTNPDSSRPFVVETWYKTAKTTRLVEQFSYCTKTEANHAFRIAPEGWVDDYKMRRVA